MTPRGTWGGSGSSLGLTTKPVQGHQPSSVPAALPHPSQTKWVCAGWSCKVPGISIPDTKLKNPRQRFAWEERRKETKTLVATSFACQPICTAKRSARTKRVPNHINYSTTNFVNVKRVSTKSITAEEDLFSHDQRTNYVTVSMWNFK